MMWVAKISDDWPPLSLPLLSFASPSALFLRSSRGTRLTMGVGSLKAPSRIT